jgi:hypothetical protein
MRNANRTGRTRESARRAIGLLSIALYLLATPVMPARQGQEEQKGLDQGNYNIKQSIEFGGRFSSVGGDEQVYDTFVNLQQGPRLLGFTTEMNSLDHHGSLFDRLYFSNFGYGGDPNDVSRLRISKNKWYSFDGLFRHDENFWDYSLQANPINPSALPASAPVGFNPIIGAPLNVLNTSIVGTSPHLFNTRRTLSDYSVIVLPDSKVRFRAGYSRNSIQGPGFTSIHQGTEQYLFDEYKTTVNAYRFGVDFRLLPRTNISYDQILSYYKGDTGITDTNQQFNLSNGMPVDLGVSFNPPVNQPCANTFGGPPAGAVNLTCSAYFSYLNHGRTRTNTPTEQLSMQSNYWKDWDLSARVSYSGGDSNVFGYNETIFGRESRTNLRNDGVTGPIHNRRVAANADFGATWHITDKLSFVDSFHYLNWHDPGEFDAGDCSFFSPNLLTTAHVFTPTAATPLTCAAPAGTILGTPAHSGSSLADSSVIVDSNFLKQDEKTNLAEFEYQFSRKIGGRLGFRYRHRAIDDNFFETKNEIYFPNNAARGDCALVTPAQPLTQGNLPTGCTLNGDGSISFVTPPSGSSFASGLGQTLINEYAGVFGLWARPTSNWRISFDTELMSADKAFTRISPRQSQEYRVRTTYKPTSWLNVNGSITIWEGRDNVENVNNLQHNRSYGFSALFQPTEKYGFELGYDYNDVYSQILICFTSSAAPVGPSTVNCPGVTGLQQQLSTYTNKSNYGYFDFSVTPVRRLTARVGANLTGTSGSALLVITPSVPSGSLNSKWLHPFGGVDYHFAKDWTAKAYWDYYGYHEDPTPGTAQDVFAPRNFRANLVTLSVRYAF